MRQTVEFIRNNYGAFSFTCKDYQQLYELMKHDKKNADGQINFTLLSQIGELQLDRHLSQDDVFCSFDFLREG